MSSKIRPSFQKTKTQQLVVQKKPIDPRFSSSYGDFDPIVCEVEHLKNTKIIFYYRRICSSNITKSFVTL